MHYESLASEYQRLESMLAETEGEITQEVQALQDSLDFSESEKLDSVVDYIQYLDNCAAACRSKVKQLEVRARNFESRAGWQRSCLMNYLSKRGMSKRKTAFHDVSVRPAGGQQAIHVELDSLDPSLKIAKTVEYADMEAIRKMLEFNGEIPGASLVARKQILCIK